MVEMALRRRRIYQVQDARSSILARGPLRPDTLPQTVQFGSQTTLANRAGHTSTTVHAIVRLPPKVAIDRFLARRTGEVPTQLPIPSQMASVPIFCPNS